MLIVLEGVDGVGKTTLAKEIASRDPSFSYVSRHDLPSLEDYRRSQMQQVASLMWAPEGGKFDHLLPTDYWIFLQTTWYTLLNQFVINPLLENNKSVVIDGWYYKFLARLEIQGHDINYLKLVFDRIPKPDHVILLQSDVENIFRRKKHFRSCEVGFNAANNPRDFKNLFIQHQTQTNNNLLKYAEALSWSVVSLATDDIATNTNLIKLEINKLLKREQIA